jgi:hypothetical protein
MRPRRLSHARHRVGSPMELGRAPGAPTVTYQALEPGWWLWLPCSRCGGVHVPLQDRLDGSETAFDRWCPGCETHQRRLEPVGSDPTVWYDTWLEDWVVRLPCGGLRAGALLPMEIRWFDAAWAEVIRVAADLAYGPEA